MAGTPGFYAVALKNGDAGVVRVPGNQRPTSVGGHPVTQSSYLGTSRQDILGNWDLAAGQIGAQGLKEFGPPGVQSAILGAGIDRGTIIDQAMRRGSAIVAKTPSGAEWDPTFTAIAGGFGGIVSGAIRSAGEAAAATTAADTAAGTAATGATSGATAAKVISGASKTAAALDIATVVAGVWTALTTPKMWLRVLEFIGGAALIFWALKSLTGVQVPAMKIAKAVA